MWVETDIPEVFINKLQIQTSIYSSILPIMWQIVLPNLIQLVRSKKKIGGGVLTATVLATFVLRKIYTKWKIHKNVRKIQKKRDGLRERKLNLKQRYSKENHKLFYCHIISV